MPKMLHNAAKKFDWGISWNNQKVPERFLKQYFFYPILILFMVYIFMRVFALYLFKSSIVQFSYKTVF